MPTVFEQYAPYRPAITAEEQEMLGMGQRNQEMLLADPNVRHWERGWLDGDGKQVPYPLQQEQMRIALNRASDQLRNWSGRQTMFPEEPDIVERFPGVDPLGKACEVDMAFAERYARLQAVLSSRPPEIQAYVGQRLQDIINSIHTWKSNWKQTRFRQSRLFRNLSSSGLRNMAQKKTV